jgi:hypothetical protein
MFARGLHGLTQAFTRHAFPATAGFAALALTATLLVAAGLGGVRSEPRPTPRQRDRWPRGLSAGLDVSYAENVYGIPA